MDFYKIQNYISSRHKIENLIGGSTGKSAVDTIADFSFYESEDTIKQLAIKKLLSGKSNEQVIKEIDAFICIEFAKISAPIYEKLKSA